MKWRPFVRPTRQLVLAFWHGDDILRKYLGKLGGSALVWGRVGVTSHPEGPRHCAYIGHASTRLAPNVVSICMLGRPLSSYLV